MLLRRVSRLLRRQAGAAALAGVLALGLLAASRTFAGTSAAPSHEPGAAASADLTGIARVVDGDTIVLGDTRIRLEGIDAPEASQTCTTRAGATWPCGTVATNTLARLVEGRRLACADRGRDKYGRTLAICYLGGLDVNAEMVRRGLAWAFVRYSRAYVAEESRAREAGIGIWSGSAVPAWDYRAGRWQVAETSAPAGCAIKGNVSHSERIYHMPWSPWYDRIKMDAGHGKRWFCSEAEALAAGWRPALMH